MKHLMKDIKEMNTAFYHSVRKGLPEWWDNSREITKEEKEELTNHLRMVTEEFLELLEAVVGEQETSSLAGVHKFLNSVLTAFVKNDHAAPNLVEIADACVDTIVLIVSTGVVLGIPLDAVWDEVQRNNMSKAVYGKVTKVRGKVQKPPGWQPPRIDIAVQQQSAMWDNSEEEDLAEVGIKLVPGQSPFKVLLERYNEQVLLLERLGYPSPSADS